MEGKNRTEGKGKQGKGDNVYFANRARRAFPVIDSYFGANGGILRRFV